MGSWHTHHQELGAVQAAERKSVHLELDFSAAISLVVSLTASAPVSPDVPASLGDRPVLCWWLFDAVERDGPQWAVEDTTGGYRHRFSEVDATSSRRRFVVPFGPRLFVGLQVVRWFDSNPHPSGTVDRASISLFIRGFG